jgi:membrane-associated protease RseP (regulator of RpoE activity)
VRIRIGAGIAAAVVSLGLCGGPASADVQAKEVATKEAWVDGIHLGDRGGIGQPFVIEVSRTSPARLAGLKAGDEIVRVQDAPVRGLHDAVGALNDLAAGRMVKIFVDRGAVPISVEFVSPGRQKNAAKSAALKRPRKDGNPQSEPKDGAGTGRQAQPADTADAPAALRKHRRHKETGARPMPQPRPTGSPASDQPSPTPTPALTDKG